MPVPKSSQDSRPSSHPKRIYFLPNAIEQRILHSKFCLIVQQLPFQAVTGRYSVNLAPIFVRKSDQTSKRAGFCPGTIFVNLLICRSLKALTRVSWQQTKYLHSNIVDIAPPICQRHFLRFFYGQFDFGNKFNDQNKLMSESLARTNYLAHRV